MSEKIENIKNLEIQESLTQDVDFVSLSDIFKKDEDVIRSILEKATEENVRILADNLGLKLHHKLGKSKIINELVLACRIVKDKYTLEIAGSNIVNSNSIVNDAMTPVKVEVVTRNLVLQERYGDTFVIANDYIPPIVHFVPYGSEYYENGRYLPKAIVDLLKSKRYNTYRGEDYMKSMFAQSPDPKSVPIHISEPTYSVNIIKD